MISRNRLRDRGLEFIALVSGVLAVAGSSASGPAPTSREIAATAPRQRGVTMTNASGPVYTARGLVRMSREEIDGLYRRSGVGPIPEGRVRGTVLLFSGTALAGPASRASRLFWQGKVFRTADATVMNRFFGLKAVKGSVYPGASWMDGRAATIIDYQETSRVYANYRDEIRQVAPGLYLGAMYARTTPQPKLRMYFVLEAQP